MECELKDCTGVQDLFLIFRGTDTYLFNIDWFEFEQGSGSVSGDVNSDGKLSASDIAVLQKYFFGNTTVTMDKDAADISGDGKIDISDYCMLKNIILKQEQK